MKASKTMTVLFVIMLATIFLGAAQGVTVTKNEKVRTYDIGADVEVSVWVSIENNSEAGEFTLTWTNKTGFSLKDNSQSKATLDVVGEERLLKLIFEPDESVIDGKYLFNLTVSNSTGAKVWTDNFEVEVGEGGSDGACATVFLAVGLVAIGILFASIGIVRKR